MIILTIFYNDFSKTINLNRKIKSKFIDIFIEYWIANNDILYNLTIVW